MPFSSQGHRFDCLIVDGGNFAMAVDVRSLQIDRAEAAEVSLDIEHMFDTLGDPSAAGWGHRAGEPRSWRGRVGGWRTASGEAEYA